MALPITIAEQIGQQNSYHGPFRSFAGNIYTILIDDTAATDANIMAFKADGAPPAEPTGFTEVDSGNQPQMGAAATSEVVSLNVFQKSDLLYIVTQNVLFEVYHAQFDMAADAWVDLGTSDFDIEVTNPDAGDMVLSSCDICVLDDDKIRITYQGETDKVMGVDRDRVEHAWSTDGGGSFTATLAINAVGDEGDSSGPRIATDGTDAWVVWSQTHQADVNNLFEVSIHPDDTLQGTLQDTTFQLTTGLYAITHGVCFDRLGTKKVRFGYREVTTLDLEILEFDVTQDPTSFSSSAAYSTSNVSLINNSIVACLAMNGSSVNALFSETTGDDVDHTHDQDIDTWATNTQAFASTLINHISCNVFWRDGPKLAYIMDDNGTIKYDEQEGTQFFYTLGILSDAEMAAQNQFAGPFEV